MTEVQKQRIEHLKLQGFTPEKIEEMIFNQQHQDCIVPCDAPFDHRINNKQMKVDIELLPVINKVVSDCEERLSLMVGSRVKLEMAHVSNDINEFKIQTLVCNEFNVSWPELIAHSRVSHLVDARHAYWWLSYVWLKSNYSQIGRDFDKDHTSVMHGVRRIKNLIETKDPIAQKIRNIERKMTR